MILETATGSLYPLTPHKSISRKLHVLKLQCLVSDQIIGRFPPPASRQFFAVTEIEDSDETFVSFLAKDAENAVIMNIVMYIHHSPLSKTDSWLRICSMRLRVWKICPSTEDLEFHFSGKLPLESTTVDIAGICSLIRILL